MPATLALRWESEFTTVYKEYNKMTTEGMKLAYSLIRKMKILADDNDAKLVVVNIPTKLNVLEKYQETFVRSNYPLSKEFFDFEGFGRKFGIKIRSMNITYYDLTAVALENNQDFFFKSDAHWSPKGVELSSEYLIDNLKDDGLI